MGWNVSFIAFDHAPDLASVRWLRDYRLLKREGHDEWYLDGPSSDPNTLLYERPVLAGDLSSAAWKMARKEYEHLVLETREFGRRTFGLDDELIRLALALSASLQTRLLVVSCNDEDLDCAFICEMGRWRRGRFLVGEAEVLLMDDGQGSELQTRVWSDGHRLYGEAAIVAADFFGSADAESYAAAWEAPDAGTYKEIVGARQLLAERVQNKYIGCAVIALAFAVLWVVFTVFRAAAIPIGLALLVVALVWRYWPSKRL